MEVSELAGVLLAAGSASAAASACELELGGGVCVSLASGLELGGGVCVSLASGLELGGGACVSPAAAEETLGLGSVAGDGARTASAFAPCDSPVPVELVELSVVVLWSVVTDSSDVTVVPFVVVFVSCVVVDVVTGAEDVTKLADGSEAGVVGGGVERTGGGASADDSEPCETDTVAPAGGSEEGDGVMSATTGALASALASALTAAAPGTFEGALGIGRGRKE